MRVDKALEASLDLARAVLDSQLADLDVRARSMAVELNPGYVDNLRWPLLACQKLTVE